VMSCSWRSGVSVSLIDDRSWARRAQMVEAPDVDASTISQ
jgi:hypothetical protein